MQELIVWSGRLAVIAFILNFATCFVMPWSKDKCPWRGERPGCDIKDSEGKFTLSHYHHYFTWATIILVTIHVILAVAAR